MGNWELGTQMWLSWIMSSTLEEAAWIYAVSKWLRMCLLSHQTDADRALGTDDWKIKWGRDCSKIRWRRRADCRSKGEHSHRHLERLRLSMASRLNWSMGAGRKIGNVSRKTKWPRRSQENKNVGKWLSYMGIRRGLAEAQPLGGRSLAKGWEVLAKAKGTCTKWDLSQFSLGPCTGHNSYFRLFQRWISLWMLIGEF